METHKGIAFVRVFFSLRNKRNEIKQKEQRVLNSKCHESPPQTHTRTAEPSAVAVLSALLFSAACFSRARFWAEELPMLPLVEALNAPPPSKEGEVGDRRSADEGDRGDIGERGDSGDGGVEGGEAIEEVEARRCFGFTLAAVQRGSLTPALRSTSRAA